MRGRLGGLLESLTSSPGAFRLGKRVEKLMWEAAITCKACNKTHLICADFRPRTFGFECPETEQRVDMPFRDPSKIISPWSEVEVRSPEAISALSTEEQGRFEV